MRSSSIFIFIYSLHLPHHLLVAIWWTIHHILFLRGFFIWYISQSTTLLCLHRNLRFKCSCIVFGCSSLSFQKSYEDDLRWLGEMNSIRALVCIHIKEWYVWQKNAIWCYCSHDILVWSCFSASRSLPYTHSVGKWPAVSGSDHSLAFNNKNMSQGLMFCRKYNFAG